MSAKRNRPDCAPGAVPKSFATDMASIPHGHLNEFAVRVLQECMAAALPAIWLRRAQVLEDARPRRGDFHGNATRQELSERWQRLTREAEACRLHAAFLQAYPDAMKQQIDADIAELFASPMMGVAAYDSAA